MKPVTLFYQPRCPFCKKALAYLEELQRKEPYSKVQIKMIDELAEPELADRYDYYYVPTFYVGDKKVHEGGIFPEEVEAVLRMAREEPAGENESKNE